MIDRDSSGVYDMLFHMLHVFAYFLALPIHHTALSGIFNVDKARMKVTLLVTLITCAWTVQTGLDPPWKPFFGTDLKL